MGLMTHSKSHRGTALAEQAGALIREAGDRVGTAVEHTPELIEQARERARESDLPSRVGEKAALVGEMVGERASQLSASVPGTTAHEKTEKKGRRRKRFRRLLLLGALGGAAAYVAKQRRPATYEVDVTPAVPRDRSSDPLTDPLAEGGPVVPD
ncbi:MAG: hypothetical protein J7518_12345 [Nocardioidaceae bacterium]|nr:hypothetical protein [Nocardioidaceae bacterium]